MNKKYLILLIIPIIVFFISCDDKQDIKEKTSVVKVKKNNIVNFTLLTTDAKAIRVILKDDKITFYGFENKVVLLTFFSTWCLPCQAQIPHLINLQNKYKDKFNIIAVLTEQNISNKRIKKFIEEYKINYLVVNSDENLKLSKAIGGIKTIPTMFMINTKGKIIEKYVGSVPQEMIDIDIQKGFGEQ